MSTHKSAGRYTNRMQPCSEKKRVITFKEPKGTANALLSGA